MKVSLDGGITYVAAPLGVQVTYDDTDLPGDGRVGHLSVSLDRRWVSLDVWVEKSNWEGYRCVAETNETPEEVLARLVRSEARDETCCICERPAVTHYDDREDCPSCGSPVCEYKMQAVIDHQGDVS